MSNQEPLMADPPTPIEWYHPTLTFEDADSRRVFERILTDKRDAVANVPSDAPQSAREAARTQRDVCNTLLQRIGQATDPTEPIEFETPGELNVALMAANYVYAVIQGKSQDKDVSVALDNVGEIIAALVDAHWRDGAEIYDQLEAVQEQYE
jgi:hypothetical protein